MSEKLYVGNLNFSTLEDTLEKVFSRYGEITSVSIIKDRNTDKSKGFGFIEYSDSSSIQKAVSAMDGKELDGRKLRVSVAQDRNSHN